jgi:hypothetical protein
VVSNRRLSARALSAQVGCNPGPTHFESALDLTRTLSSVGGGRGSCGTSRRGDVVATLTLRHSDTLTACPSRFEETNIESLLRPRLLRPRPRAMWQGTVPLCQAWYTDGEEFGINSTLQSAPAGSAASHCGLLITGTRWGWGKAEGLQDSWALWSTPVRAGETQEKSELGKQRMARALRPTPARVAKT